MRFRTKLFIAWSILVLVLYAATLWPVHRTISESFDHISRDAFAGTKQSLRDLQGEQITRMRQECTLIMNIPDLRALIAENSAELTPDNLESLQERLDSLSSVVRVPVIFVLDQRGKVIAQNSGSPWQSVGHLGKFLDESPQARALVRKIFSPQASGNSPSASRASDGIWSVHDQLLQAVAVPLIFDSDAGAESDIQGALVMASPLTDALANKLARGNNSSVSFITGRTVIASSFPSPLRNALAAAVSNGPDLLGSDFKMPLANSLFRSSYEPLVDPASQTLVGGTLIQSNLADSAKIQNGLWENLAFIALIGLILAAGTSFVLSATVTRPVQLLLEAVGRVSGGDLSVSIPGADQRKGELGELARDFNHMVQQLKNRRELERLVEESRAASEAKSQFLANMSHEIRTPLNGVLGITELLRATDLSARQSRYADLLQTSGKILANIINDILDFSKIEAGKLELESIDFDLPQALREVLDVLQPKAHAKSLELRSVLAPTLAQHFRGDAKRLQQILINLTNNAIKFTDAGHITVAASLEKSLDGAALVRFEVTDTGIGIPPDRIGRLFQSFSQVDASTTRKYGGTGLGLAICKQLAELMGGQIGVKSDAGKGSTFWFTARFLSAQQNPSALPAPGASAPARRGHILIAEDNEVNQLVASEALRTAGHTCDIASNGKQVIEALRRTRYDLILMDCQMPEMDGFEATRHIRRQEQSAKTPRLPIIALTANAVKSDRDDCLAAGMDDYLSKPIDFAALAEVLARHLAGVAPSPTRLPPTLAVTASPINAAAFHDRYASMPEIIAALLERAGKQLATYSAGLSASLEKSDFQTAAVIAHALRGSAGALEATTLVSLTRELESAAQLGNMATFQARIQDIQREIEACRVQIPGLVTASRK